MVLQYIYGFLESEFRISSDGMSCIGQRPLHLVRVFQQCLSLDVSIFRLYVVWHTPIYLENVRQTSLIYALPEESENAIQVKCRRVSGQYNEAEGRGYDS